MREKFAYSDKLPKELKEQVRGNDRDVDRVLVVLEAGGGTLNVNEMLIGWYHLFKEIKTRQQIVALAYRAFQDGSIYKTGRKGEYSVKAATGKGE